AIDYCPPVGITFGAYLRAIITADYDMNPVDRENWRLAFIESFREWGISPRGTRSMAEDSLLWPTQNDVIEARATVVVPEQRTTVFQRYTYSPAQRRRGAMPKTVQRPPPPASDDQHTRKGARAPPPQPPGKPDRMLTPTPLSMRRFEIWLDTDKQAAWFHSWL